MQHYYLTITQVSYTTIKGLLVFTTKHFLNFVMDWDGGCGAEGKGGVVDGIRRYVYLICSTPSDDIERGGGSARLAEGLDDITCSPPWTAVFEGHRPPAVRHHGRF